LKKSAPAHGQTILVLGADGFVGSAVVAEARAKGIKVLPVTRSNYAEMLGSQCDVLINANGNSRKYLAAKDPVRDFELSVTSVARSLKEFISRRYVYLSSIDVYSDASTPANSKETQAIDFDKVSTYGFHKHLAEQLVRHFAPKWVILRMGGFVGDGLWKNSVHDMLKSRSLRVHPDSEYQYMNTRGLARVLLSLLDLNTDNGLFNVAGHGTISLVDVAAMIPGYTLPEDACRQPKERYEVDIRKIRRVCPTAETRATVQAFIRDVIAGTVTLK